MNKREILDLIIELLQKEEALLISAGLAAREAATESEAKPENQYDTRGLEQSYLAAGQGRRAKALKISILNFKSLPLHSFDASTPIDISAVVRLASEQGDFKTYFVLPTFGGVKVIYKNKEIFTLSPESPLGEAIVGKLGGDVVEVKTAGQVRSYSILSVE